jgi:acyl-CoA synthetase (AMP-forming)/AMP-acid ligase II
MNAIDVIFFQAEVAPDKLALVAYGSIIPYGRFVHGILSAQQRLTAIGVQPGQTVAISITNPIDHMVFACALYRMKVASASIANAIDAYLDRVPFDMVLSDKILTTVATKQPSAKFLLVDKTWFQDKVEMDVGKRTSSRRGASDWSARIICYPDRPGFASVVKTTSQALEEQLMSYCLTQLGPHDFGSRIANQHRLRSGAVRAVAWTQRLPRRPSARSKPVQSLQARLSGRRHRGC